MTVSNVALAVPLMLMLSAGQVLSQELLPTAKLKLDCLHSTEDESRFVKTRIADTDLIADCLEHRGHVAAISDYSVVYDALGNLKVTENATGDVLCEVGSLAAVHYVYAFKSKQGETSWSSTEKGVGVVLIQLAVGDDAEESLGTAMLKYTLKEKDSDKGYSVDLKQGGKIQMSLDGAICTGSFKGSYKYAEKYDDER